MIFNQLPNYDYNSLLTDYLINTFNCIFDSVLTLLPSITLNVMDIIRFTYGYYSFYETYRCVLLLYFIFIYNSRYTVRKGFVSIITMISTLCFYLLTMHVPCHTCFLCAYICELSLGNTNLFFLN